VIVPLLLASAPSLLLPIYTAYCEPNPEAIEISEAGHSVWTDPRQTLNWYGKLSKGTLNVTVRAALSGGDRATYKLLIAKRGIKRDIIGGDTEFGPFTIPKDDFYRIRLEVVHKTGSNYGAVQAIGLSGTALTNSHFNLKERRNAASVHLKYPSSTDDKIDAFYTEVKAETDPIYTYYMADGFRRGYFGMQVNSPTERRIIFSIWDSGNEAVDRSKVSADDRVTLLAKGDGVSAGDFGNEGTGGHSHLVYNWKTRDRQRFLVTVKPDGTHTTYSGYYYFNDRRAWGLIASFRAPKDGNYLSGLYSFVENFGGDNGQLFRQAKFGNQWVRSHGVWRQITDAQFSCDATGRPKDRIDFDAGSDGSDFWLSNGGFRLPRHFVDDQLTRKPSGKPPVIPAELLPSG
jgi:hypothetical protein